MKAIEAAARAFVTFNADNEWSLSQVQGFRYGQDHVVRDCMLPGDRQEIWRRPVSDTSPDDMRDFIDCYRAQQAMEAAICAYLTALAEDDAAVERVAKAVHSERQAAGYSGQAAWEYEPPSIHSLYIRTARAALNQVLDQSPP